jgi:hypothetical protein
VRNPIFPFFCASPRRELAFGLGVRIREWEREREREREREIGWRPVVRKALELHSLKW